MQDILIGSRNVGFGTVSIKIHLGCLDDTFVTIVASRRGEKYSLTYPLGEDIITVKRQFTVKQSKNVVRHITYDKVPHPTIQKSRIRIEHTEFANFTEFHAELSRIIDEDNANIVTNELGVPRPKLVLRTISKQKSPMIVTEYANKNGDVAVVLPIRDGKITLYSVWKLGKHYGDFGFVDFAQRTADSVNRMAHC